MNVELRACGRCLVAAGLELELQDFTAARGSYSGAIFLLASGPSSVQFPLQSYPGVALMAMNGSILRCLDEGIRPLFYLCDDPNFVIGRLELALKGVLHSDNLAMSLDVLEQIHAASPTALHGKKVYLLERVNRGGGKAILSDRAYAWSIRNDPELISNFSLLRRKPNRIGFSLNLCRGYFGSRTVPFAGLQLACHLGFRQAFLIGMDLRQAGGRFYEQGAGALPSSLDEDFEQYILPSFQLMAKKIAPRTGLRVFNLSTDSRMPDSVVPKLSLAALDQLLTGQDPLLNRASPAGRP